LSFVSWAFLALFGAVLLARLTVGRRKVGPAYAGVLILASIVFYAWHIPIYVAILSLSCGIDFLAGRWLGRATAEATRRLILILSVGSNLGLLGFFKYGTFALEVLEDLLGTGAPAGLAPEVGLALPMGISFYTFQSMSYTIDVYRGLIPPVRSFWGFFLFVSFFPQLVAGPIVRASEFLPQMPRARRLRARVAYEGMWLIVSGFFLKMVCADNLAVYVDEHWERGAQAGTSSAVALWLALMFSGQIFADFAGYSNIARGVAYLLGYRLPLNFRAPYLAASFKNFWERWHVTLSRWLRDYLYVSLGGNRRGAARTYANLLIVMLLGGLWHGAAYTFLAWGALHGTALALERLLGLHRRHGVAALVPIRVLWFAVVQSLVLASWIVFRSTSMGEAVRFVSNVLAFDGWALGTLEWAGALFLAPLVAAHAWTWAEERGIVRPLGAAARSVLAALMVYAVLTLYAGTSDFIYFQF
jgi:alginate O-acetyltransferase complex protein AlgI